MSKDEETLSPARTCMFFSEQGRRLIYYLAFTARAYYRTDHFGDSGVVKGSRPLRFC